MPVKRATDGSGSLKRTVILLIIGVVALITLIEVRALRLRLCLIAFSFAQAAFSFPQQTSLITTDQPRPLPFSY
jgi:hypothetical protein